FTHTRTASRIGSKGAPSTPEATPTLPTLIVAPEDGAGVAEPPGARAGRFGAAFVPLALPPPVVEAGLPLRAGVAEAGAGADVAVAEVVADQLAGSQLGRRPAPGHLALLEEVDVVGQRQGPVDELLDEQQRRPLFGQPGQEGEDLVDDDGGQAEGDLVEEDET